MNEMERNLLIEKAREAVSHSYAPYSQYHVGAALLCDDGSIFQGCNIENASYSVTVCAERTALFSAVFQLQRHFKAIAIASSGMDFVFPCGSCRQALSEFCQPDFTVICTNAKGEYKEMTLGELLPCSFGGDSLS